MATDLDQPIFVIGTHRSGTTLLGRALGHHHQVAYWEEPRHVWSYGHNFRPDDVLSAGDATPRVARRIRTTFGRFLERSGNPRFAEKTPSNCLRLPFIFEIFPDGRFVHIHRDGRAVVHSTEVVTRTRRPDTEWYARRLFGTPIWEWPALIPRAWRTLGRRLLGADMAYWGPQPPGWRDWVGTMPRDEILARQWRGTLEPVLEFRDAVPADQWLDIRYEDLVAKPEDHARSIEAFCSLAPCDAFHRHLCEECHQDRVDAWRDALDPAALERLRPILEPSLRTLGYAW